MSKRSPNDDSHDGRSRRAHFARNGHRPTQGNRLKPTTGFSSPLAAERKSRSSHDQGIALPWPSDLERGRKGVPVISVLDLTYSCFGSIVGGHFNDRGAAFEPFSQSHTGSLPLSG